MELDESNGVPIEVIVDAEAARDHRLIAELAERKRMSFEEAMAIFRSFDRALSAEDA